MIQDCFTCKHSLGGGCCKLNSELECADDDARPLWTPITVFPNYVDAANYRDLLQPEHYKATTTNGKVYTRYDEA